MGPETSRKRVKAEVVAFGKLFAALTTLKRKDRVSEFDVTIYEERTAHIPISILSRAVSKILDTATWFPTVAELLEACEAVRLEMRAALKFQPCDCEVCSNGWRITTTDGITNAWRVLDRASGASQGVRSTRAAAGLAGAGRIRGGQ
jgi:hypothetical protein